MEVVVDSVVTWWRGWWLRGGDSGCDSRGSDEVVASSGSGVGWRWCEGGEWLEGDDGSGDGCRNLARK
ncbi:hypothetical protein Tco_0603421 [Tanacetum coccineum]